jgi:dolichol kinase
MLEYEADKNTFYTAESTRCSEIQILSYLYSLPVVVVVEYSTVVLSGCATLGTNRPVYHTGTNDERQLPPFTHIKPDLSFVQHTHASQPMNFLYLIIGAVVAVVILQLVVTKASELSKEGRRRVQHAATGQLLIVISYLLPIWICKMALLAGILLLLYVYYFHNSWYKEMFGPLLRESEQDTLPGAFWFLVGTWITATCFDTSIGRYAVLCLSYADPVAAWVGLSLPSPRVVGTATVSGCSACFLTALLIGWYMLESDKAVVEIGVGALACTVAESFPMGNDNLLIPIVTALAVQFARTYV